MSNDWMKGAFGGLHIRMNPDINKYFDQQGNLKPGYSPVASQQNPNPVFSYSTRIPLKGGGSKPGVSYVAYKKDAPAPAPSQAAAPAPAPAPAPTPTTPTNKYQSQITALTARIAEQQKQADAAAVAAKEDAAERAADAKDSLAQYQSSLSDLSTSFDSRLLQQQQGFDASLAQKAEEQTAFLKDLQIKQDTRLSKMALDAKARADDLALGQRTYQQNQLRSNQTGSLQIGSNEAPKTGGTQSFKRREDQFKITTPAYSGLSVSQSGMVNV
tara:strand:- start:83 stop:895 length:813 start_codon:yes stop_codon:yes gene_type:complete